VQHIGAGPGGADGVDTREAIEMATTASASADLSGVAINRTSDLKRGGRLYRFLYRISTERLEIDGL